jgi:cytoskeletal protein CcmA (bactofilin family)
MRCRVFAATAVVFVFLLGSAHAAGAQDGGAGPEQGRRVSVTGGLAVARGETVDGPAVSANGSALIDGRVNGAVYVGRGDLVVDGRVTGDALVLDGDAFISGRVGGSVTVLNGKATVRPGARVGGDVASRTAPTAARGTVQGHVEKLDVDSLFGGFVVVILAVLWVAVTLSTLILGVLFVWLFPRAADAVVIAGRRFWASFFLGLLLGVVLPILGIVVMASVVGIPLGVAVLGALAVLGPLGYVASALIFGRLMVHRSGTGGRLGAFFAGFGILRFAALVPGLGLVIGFFVSVYGIGAVIIAAWRGARRPLGAEEELPEYAATPELLVGEPLLIDTFGRPPARTARARKTRSRKAPAKKKATGTKKSRGTRSTGTRSRAAAARKSGPRTAAAKKRSDRTGSQRRKNTTKKRATRAKAAPRKSSANSARKRTNGTKRTTKKRTSTRKRSTAKKRATTNKRATTTKRATTSKRAATNTSRTAKKRGAKKSSARKASPRRSRARARA